MGFIAGLLNKKGEDVSNHVLHMIKSSSPIIGDYYGFATSKKTEIHYSVPDFLSIISDNILAYKGLTTNQSSLIQPISQNTETILFEGQLSKIGVPSQLMIAESVKEKPKKGIKEILKNRKGAYVIVVSTETEILSIRDPVGTIPLYFANSPRLVGIASNKKMLWTLGLEPIPLPPGSLLSLKRDRLKLEHVLGINKPRKSSLNIDLAVERLDNMLQSSVNDMINGNNFAYLGFSGGIDSTIIAYYLDKLGVNTTLITIGIEGSSEIEIAEETAAQMGLQIKKRVYDLNDVEKIIDEALLVIEDPDPMKISVAIPLLWAAKTASTLGRGLFFSGNGSDELFGGYYRFVRNYLNNGERVEEDIYKAVINSHAVNYERDRKIFMNHGLELKIPFANRALIQYGLSLPIQMKLPSSLYGLRKIILRKLAERKGLPEEVSYRPKKAIQYSTGVSKILEKISKTNGVSTKKFLQERFNIVRQIFLEEHRYIK